MKRLAVVVVLAVIVAILVWSPSPMPLQSEKAVVHAARVPVITTVTIPITVPVTIPTAVSAPPTTTLPMPIVVATNEDLYTQWSRVAVCESGGWVVLGSLYPNSLGITASNWALYGGGSDTSPAAQIAVAQNMIQTLGMSIPDQNGCAAW